VARPSRDLLPQLVGVKKDSPLPGRAPVGGWLHSYSRGSPANAGTDFHEALEFGIVLAGEVQRGWAGFQTTVCAGEAFLCAMWEPHTWRYASPCARAVVLMFLPQYLIESADGASVPWPLMFQDTPADRPRAPGRPQHAALLEEGEWLAQEVVGRRVGWPDAVRAHLLRALQLLGAQWTPRGHRDGAERVARVGPALALVSDERGKVALREAAEACGLSRTRFSAVFAQTMGTSFGQFCQRARVGHVARLLVQTDMPVEAIAEHLHFSSPQHLHRAFHKCLGCTPGAFRRQQRPSY
jgi:AraC-like DNA-binding protein